MARKADPPQVRLLLEPEHDNPRSLDTAWFLARQLGAVLNSILLENPDLFHIAGLPVTHEVRLTGHDLQPMDARSMEREYLLLAGRLQQAIEKRVGKSGIRCTFRRARESRQQVLTSRDQAIQVIGNPGRAVWSERPAAGGPRRWSLLYEEGAAVWFFLGHVPYTDLHPVHMVGPRSLLEKASGGQYPARRPPCCHSVEPVDLPAHAGMAFCPGRQGKPAGAGRGDGHGFKPRFSRGYLGCLYD